MRVLLPLFFVFFSVSAAGEKYYWVGGDGFWSDISHWATSSGGSTFHSVVPGIHDTVYFDINSGFTPGNNTVTINTNATCHTMIWDGAPGNPRLTNLQGFNIRVFGSVTLQEEMGVHGSLQWSFRSSQPGNTILTSGNQLRSVEFSGGGGEWILADELSVYSDIRLTEGALLTNDQQVSANSLFASGGQQKLLRLGSSELNIKEHFYVESPQIKIYLEQAVINIATYGFSINGHPEDFDAGTSTINLFGYQGAFGAFFPGHFNNVNFYGSFPSLAGRETRFNNVSFYENGNIGGNNAFDTLLFSPGKSYQLEANRTQTIVEELGAKGNPCFITNLFSSNPGQQATIQMNFPDTVIVDFIIIRDIQTTGGAVFIGAPNSTDYANNSGWDFTAAPGNYIFGFGPDMELACSDLPYLVTTGSFNPNQGTTFLWNDNSTENFLLAHEFGEYHIVVSYADFCSIKDKLVLIEPPMPLLDLGPDVYLGPEEYATLDAGPGDDHIYLWSTGETSQIIQVSSHGQYWVTVSNDYDCEVSDTIWVFTTPSVITMIPEGITTSSAVLGGEVISDGGAVILERGVFWGDDPNPADNGMQHEVGSGLGFYSFIQEGLQPNTRYFVTSYAANASGFVTGNTESFITKDIEPEVFIPNAFMPASNYQENRMFMPSFNRPPTEYSLRIYNRWGRKVFATDNPATGWDGTIDNNLAPHGSFSYIIIYRYPDYKEQKHVGVFMLIR
jgi:hypothetical protein